MPSSIRNQATLLAEYQALLTGLPKFLPNGVFEIDSQSYTSAQLVTLISGLVAALTDVTTKKENLSESRVAAAAVMATDGAIIEGAREVLAVQFKTATSTLSALGITPRKKPAPLSVAALAARSAKAEATRKARGTTSKKQKAQISGGVTGVTITPVMPPGNAPAATSGGTAPTPAASAGTPSAGATNGAAIAPVAAPGTTPRS